MYCEVLCTSQLEHVGVQLSADGEYVDWRRFLLDAAQPWPMPSEQDLLDALAAFHDMDQKNSGYVTRQQFEWVAALCVSLLVCLVVCVYVYSLC